MSENVKNRFIRANIQQKVQATLCLLSAKRKSVYEKELIEIRPLQKKWGIGEITSNYKRGAIIQFFPCR